MNILTSILAKTTTGAVFEFIILLLVAGVIAFLTSYFYYRSLYSKKITILEEEKLGKERRISVLEAEIANLNSKVSDLEKKVAEKKK